MGWIKQFYVDPIMHFPYYGFEWIKFPGETLIYAFYVLMILSLVFMMIGRFYKISSIIFFTLFTYVELIDKSLYLNHYYFVSIIALLLILVPADKVFSLNKKQLLQVPAWTIDIFKFQISVVYLFAGIAKLNPDWLIYAMPLKLWLPANSELPIIGSLLKLELTAYLASWFGAIYDLTIWYFLLNSKTRKYAYFFVFAFHLSTAIFFNIGMFPYIISLLSLVFIDSAQMEKVFKKLSLKTNINNYSYRFNPLRNIVISSFLTVFVLFQTLYPFRHIFYEGDLFWNEQGYRFGWRVMLIEKAGTIDFKILDNSTGKTFYARPSDFLTKVQETQMATQADMIVSFAHYLKEHYKKIGLNNISIYAESFASLNGSGTKRFIDPTVDLTKEKDGFEQKDWILSFK